MPKTLTFIIPAYNAEKYLDKCISSLLNPAVQDDLEIIVVNDGSTDQTETIAKKYVKEYPHMCALITKANGGHGSAINIGFQKATGKYVKVLDADDWILTENLTPFIHLLKDLSSDVVLTNFHTVHMLTGELTSYALPIDLCNHNYDFKNICELWDKIHHCIAFHGITYNRLFYLSTKTFLTEHVFYEDQEYVTIPCCQAETFFLCELYLYEYLIGNISQSMAIENQIKRLDHLEKVILHLLDYCGTLLYEKKYALSFCYKCISVSLMAYLKLVCLAFFPQKEGRALARMLSHRIRKNCPGLFCFIKKKYYIFLLLSYLNISISTFEKLMHTKLYLNFRGK